MTSNNATIEAVLFDFGMVLTGPPNPTAWARMQTISTLDEPSLQRGYWAYRHPYDRGDHTAQAYWQLVGAHNGLALTATQIDALIQADLDLWGDLNTPMVEWASQLQQAGIRTGILSNIGDAMADGLIARFGWLAHFHHRTWSYALNLAKPEPAIYRHAVQGLATPAASILFIDDKPENIAAALAIGMQAIQYSTHDRFLAEMNGRGLAHLLQPKN